MEITVNYDSTNATLFFTASSEQAVCLFSSQALLSSEVLTDFAVDDHYDVTSPDTLCGLKVGL